MNQRRLVDFVKDIAKSLDKGKITYAVSGAIANMVWGVPRATHDVDILVSTTALKPPKLIETFFALGCEGDLKDAIHQARKDYLIRLSYGKSWVEIFLPAISYHHNVLKRRILVDIEGTPVWFITAEDLVILKLLFHRTRDIADVKALLATRKDKMDIKYVKATLQNILPKGDSVFDELEQFLKK